MLLRLKRWWKKASPAGQVTIVVAVLGVLAAVLGVVSAAIPLTSDVIDRVKSSTVTSTSGPPNRGSGSIIEPKDGASVEQLITARGTVSNILEGHQPRMMLMILEASRYYPERVNLRPDGSWFGPIEIGSPDDYGKRFVLNLVDVGPKGLQELDRYYENEKTAGPVGITTEDLVRYYEVTFLDSIPLVRAGPPSSSIANTETVDGPGGERDLNQYCRTRGFNDGAYLTKKDGGAYKNWACRGESAFIDFVAACAFTYEGRRVATAAPERATDPYSWKCTLYH